MSLSGRQIAAGIVIVAAALYVIGGGGRTAPTALSSGGSARTTVARSGSGTLVTDRFTLAGDYRLDWTATDTGSTRVGCYHGSHIEPGRAGDVSVSVDGGQVSRGTTHVYGLDTGQYDFWISSGCDWTLTLTPE